MTSASLFHTSKIRHLESGDMFHFVFDPTESNSARKIYIFVGRASAHMGISGRYIALLTETGRVITTSYKQDVVIARRRCGTETI